MTISINEIAGGVAIQLGQDIYVVQDYSHVKPGKGSAFVRVKLKNIKTGQVLERTFKSAERLDDVPLEERRLQKLYESDGMIHFMDIKSFEEISVPTSVIGDGIKFLQDNTEIYGYSNNGQILKVELPTFIVAEITHTEPGFKGDSSRSGTKPATIDTGATVQVPLFIGVGERVKIDTRTATYVERVQK